MSNQKKQSVGSELVKRLKSFTEQLEKIDTPNDIAKVLTVRKITLNLAPKNYCGEEVKAIRNAMCVSQGVFAQFLGVSVDAVQDWEQNINVPSGPACRVLEEMQKDLPTWFSKFRSGNPISSGT